MGNRMVPTNEAEFLQKARNLANNISQDPARYGIPQADADAMQAAAERFAAAHQAAYRGNRTREQVEEKRLARAEAKRMFVRCVNLVRLNESADASTRYLVGIKDRPKRLKSAACPLEAPRLRFLRAIHEAGAVPVHELDFRSMVWTQTRPEGAVRLELFIDLIPPGEPIPKHPGANHGSRPWYLRSYTRSPIRLTPPMARVPMRVVYWARWADSTGNVGPFSATAVAWMEGGEYLPSINPLPFTGKQPLKILEDARAADWPDRDPQYRVALLEAQDQSFNQQRVETTAALPAPEDREVRRIAGPVGDEREEEAA